MRYRCTKKQRPLVREINSFSLFLSVSVFLIPFFPLSLIPKLRSPALLIKKHNAQGQRLLDDTPVLNKKQVGKMQVHTITGQVCVAVTLNTCIPNVMASNLGRVTNYTD
jgi:hypothetical protein